MISSNLDSNPTGHVFKKWIKENIVAQKFKIQPIKRVLALRGRVRI